jgi:hypothetical protein
VGDGGEPAASAAFDSGVVGTGVQGDETFVAAASEGSYETAASWDDPTVGGFSDLGAFTDPVGPDGAAPNGAGPSEPASGLGATFVGEGAFTDEPVRTPLAVQEPMADRAADTAADEVLRQMSKLSPKAAEAIAAALGSTVDDTPDAGSSGGR